MLLFGALRAILFQRPHEMLFFALIAAVTSVAVQLEEAAVLLLCIMAFLVRPYLFVIAGAFSVAVSDR